MIFIMKLKGMTLLETVISLAVISVTALGTSAALDTASAIFRRSEDISTAAENAAYEMAELYNSTDKTDNTCYLEINDDIIISGELLTAGNYSSDESFSEYYAARPEGISNES